MRDLIMSRRSMLAMSLAAAVVPARAWAQSSDPSLVAALRAHFGYSAGFRGKFRTGVYRFDPNTVSEAVAERAIALISERLGSLPGRNLALVHYVGDDGHLRAWLFDSEGLQASAVSREPYVHLGYLQRSLRINTRMSTRVAVRRDGRSEWDPLESTCRHASLSIL